MGAVERCSVRRTRPSDPRATCAGVRAGQKRKSSRSQDQSDHRAPFRAPQHGRQYEMPQPQDDIAEDDITQNATA